MWTVEHRQGKEELGNQQNPLKSQLQGPAQLCQGVQEDSQGE